MSGSFANIHPRENNVVGISFRATLCNSICRPSVTVVGHFVRVAQLKFDVIWNFIRVKVRKSFVRTQYPCPSHIGARARLRPMPYQHDRTAGAELSSDKFIGRHLLLRFQSSSVRFTRWHPCHTLARMQFRSSGNIGKLLARSERTNN